jgi:hypothetical protein
MRYSQELNQFQMDCEGFCHISKRDFFRLFWKAYKKTFILSNIQSGWGKTGIHLFVPKMVLDKFVSKHNPNEERLSSSDSSDLILMAEDWQKIRSLIKEVVSNISDKRVQKLNDTV